MAFRRAVRVLFPIAAVCCALLFVPLAASADTLTGSADINWLYPSTSTIFATDTLDVGSSISCPSASPLCAGYSGLGSETFSLGSSTVSLVVSGYPASDYAVASMNGFDFAGLTFLGGGSLTGFTLTTNMPGLSASDVAFGPSSIEVNLEGLPVNGEFTLDLISSSGAIATPEPSSLVLLGAGVGLLALIGLMLRRKATAYA